MAITIDWGPEPNQYKVAHVERDAPNKIFIDGLFPWKRSEIFFTSLIISHETLHNVFNRMGLWYAGMCMDEIHGKSKCDYTGLPKVMSQGKV